MTMNTEHHRRSIRLKGYDYTQPGAYFVTICTYQKTCLFGEIIAGEMHLNSFGNITTHEMIKLPQRFSNMVIDEATVMPNHVHAIWVIKSTTDGIPEPPMNGTHHTFAEHFGKPISGSIATMVRSYKSSATLRIHRIRGEPSGPIWQRNYYEHIIRSEAEWQQIREYIRKNPSRWDSDDYRMGM